METDRVDVSGVELGGLLEEGEARVRLDDVLHQRHEVLGHQVRPAGAAALVQRVRIAVRRLVAARNCAEKRSRSVKRPFHGRVRSRNPFPNSIQ